jgi:hypothetical protein
VKILFDQGTPGPLRRALVGHVVQTAYERGWSTFLNGDLLSAAENATFGLLITTDKSLGDQQNLSARSIAIIVLPTTQWSEIQQHLGEILAAVDSIKAGEYRELTWTNPAQ